MGAGDTAAEVDVDEEAGDVEGLGSLRAELSGVGSRAAVFRLVE